MNDQDDCRNSLAGSASVGRQVAGSCRAQALLPFPHQRVEHIEEPLDALAVTDLYHIAKMGETVQNAQALTTSVEAIEPEILRTMVQC